MEAPLVEARPAATVMLIRDSGAGIEVLVVRRRPRGFFGGLTVFPGGAVDAVDASGLAGEWCPANTRTRSSGWLPFESWPRRPASP